MLDQLSNKRTPLAGWIWDEIKDIEFDSIFCPFTGRPYVPIMFKEHGKGVIAADLLSAHYTLCHALIENQTSALDPFMVDVLLEKNPDKKQMLEGVCNAYDLAPEHGAWLDNVYSNIDKIEDPYSRSLALTVCAKVIRYLLSFDSETRGIMPDDDLTAAFNYYVEFYNSRVFPGSNPCEAHLADANSIIRSIDSQAMYFYIPSSTGFGSLSPERRLIELFCRRITESELDHVLQIDPSNLGAPHSDSASYIAAIEGFLEKARTIPAWFLSYNKAGLLSVEQIKEIIEKSRTDIRIAERKVFYPADETQTEVLFIARG